MCGACLLSIPDHPLGVHSTFSENNTTKRKACSFAHLVLSTLLTARDLHRRELRIIVLQLVEEGSHFLAESRWNRYQMLGNSQPVVDVVTLKGKLGAIVVHRQLHRYNDDMVLSGGSRGSVGNSASGLSHTPTYHSAPHSTCKYQRVADAP